MIKYLLCWIATLAIAFVAGKLMAKIKMPSILGWLIAGILLVVGAICVFAVKDRTLKQVESANPREDLMDM